MMSKRIIEIVLFFILIVLAAIVRPAPITNPDPEESAGFVEGDMILSEGEMNYLKGISTGKPQTRNGLIAEESRWPNRLVYYKIKGKFDQARRNAILDAIATIEARTCVRFKEADSSRKDYVAITSDAGGCYTAVGYKGREQQMNLEVYPLGEGCFRIGSIQHEFMHALGFFHQQSDANRDDYIQVLSENIIPGKEFNFEKYSASVITDLDVGYDYKSVLHYRAGAFSKNGKDTIVPLDPKAEIGQRVGLSEKDVKKINIMYKCPIQI